MQRQRFYSQDKTETFTNLINMPDDRITAYCQSLPTLAALKELVNAGRMILNQKSDRIIALKDDMAKKLHMPRSILDGGHADIIVRYMAIGNCVNPNALYRDEIDENELLNAVKVAENDKKKTYHVYSLVQQIYITKKDEQSCLKRMCCLL
jgi:hypothetical protein